MISAFVSALLTFSLYLGLNAFLFNRKPSNRPLLQFGLTYLWCTPFAILFPLLIQSPEMDGLFSERLQIALLCAFCFGFICLGYLQFWALTEFSITIRMLVHLQQAKSKTLTTSEMKELYPFEEVLERKIKNTLAAEKLFYSTPAGIMSDRAGYFFGKIFFHVKKFCNWGGGG